jgi:hypothetical protein
MNGFLSDGFNRTGRPGIRIDIGKGKGLGGSRTIDLDRKKRDRN